MADKTKMDILQGTLDLLILRVLARDENHGWGIADRIECISRAVLCVGEGSLYPALYRMEAKGWVKSRWSVSENNRRAKFYRLTPVGKRQLDAEQESWRQMTSAVAAILQLA